MEFERIYTENPKVSLWQRMDILTTFKGVKNVLESKAIRDEINISPELLNLKSTGISFCIRSARDLFKISNPANLTPSLTALYYGTYNLLNALILSDLKNSYTLSDVEGFSKNGGHGLKTLYLEDSLDLNNSEFVYCSTNGFFKEVLKYFGYDYKLISVDRNIKSFEKAELDKEKLISFEDLVSRIPELKNIYLEVFKKQPNYLHHQSWVSNFPDISTYRILVNKNKNSQYLEAQDINRILCLPENYLFEFRKERGTDTYEQFICENIPADLVPRIPHYKSSISESCSIKPLLGIIHPFLYYFQLLYILSIWTRYRPNLWRKINEGELEHYRSLLSVFTEASERVLPNLFLNKFYNRDILFAGHSYYS